MYSIFTLSALVAGCAGVQLQTHDHLTSSSYYDDYDIPELPGYRYNPEDGYYYPLDFFVSSSTPVIVEVESESEDEEKTVNKRCEGDGCPHIDYAFNKKLYPFLEMTFEGFDEPVLDHVVVTEPAYKHYGSEPEECDELKKARDEIK